ncbi:MAG: hypothetical protein WAW88_08805 [Nocardioides sp.]
MAERVVPYDLTPDIEFGWEPNAPDAVLVSDDFGRAALAQKAHPDDPDQRCVVLRWEMVILAQLTPPNDEGRHEHRLYDDGLRDLLWIGVVRESQLVEQLKSSWPRAGDRRGVPIHYAVVSKECVVEVVAMDVEVFRIDGTPRQAATASFEGPS